MADYSGNQKSSLHRRMLLAVVMVCVLVFAVWQLLKLIGITDRVEMLVKERTAEPVVIGCLPNEGILHPLLAGQEGDLLLVELTQAMLLGCDRDGQPVLQGIEGESRPYGEQEYTYYGLADVSISPQSDGSVWYDFSLRKNVRFHDGEELNADDLIFTMYALCDSSYEGPFAFADLPIKGLGTYLFEGGMLWQRILFDGKAESAGGMTEEGCYYTAEEAAAFWQLFDQAGEAFAREIVDYCAQNGYSPAEDVAAAAEIWGYDGLRKDASAADFWQELVNRHGYDLSKDGIDSECAGTSIITLIQERVKEELPRLCEMLNSARAISGIKRLDDYTVRLVLDHESRDGLAAMMIPVLPMHYYGMEDRYDYERSSFGFTKGNYMELYTSGTPDPMGAGPYLFVERKEKKVSLKANYQYFLGVPGIYNPVLYQFEHADEARDFANGELDIIYAGDAQNANKMLEEIKEELEKRGESKTVVLVDKVWIFNGDSIVMDSLPPDRTQAYSWLKEIWRLEE